VTEISVVYILNLTLSTKITQNKSDLFNLKYKVRFRLSR